MEESRRRVWARHSLRGRSAASGRAVARDVAELATVVARLLAGGLRALARDVSLLAAVEALGRVDAVTREVTDAAARVARLGAAEAAGTALLETTLVTATLLTLRAHARDVTRLAATVADTGTGAAARGETARREAAGRGTGARVLGALARDVTRVTARVALLRDGRVRAVARDVALLVAVVALGGTSSRAARRE